MIVYVESNFVLELALEQEEFESCYEILDLARRDRIELIIPAYCFVEPLVAWARRSTNRRLLLEQISAEQNQLSRSEANLELVQDLRRLTSDLAKVTEEEGSRLTRILDDLTSIVQISSLDPNVIVSSSDIRQRLSLGPQDAAVYASVIAHVTSQDRGEEKCFLNSDAKDFMIPEIQDELKSYNCVLIPKFDDGLGFIRTRL